MGMTKLVLYCHYPEKQKDVSVHRYSGVYCAVFTFSYIQFQIQPNNMQVLETHLTFGSESVGLESCPGCHFIPFPSIVSFICRHRAREQEQCEVQRAMYKCVS